REMQHTGAVSSNGEIVSIQPAAKWQRMRWDGGLLDVCAAEHLSLREVDIEIAVVVVIEEGDAAPDHLGEVKLPGHAVEIREVETGRLRPIDKPIVGGRVTNGRRGRS